MNDTVRDEVRDRYARAALAVLDGGGCCGPAVADPVFGPGLYDAVDLAPLPEDAVAASLGCGNPTALADLRPGEIVLDLGSGGGIDVLLAATRVGPTGMAYGVDMTTEMLALARRNAAAAGVENVRFLEGEIEAIPLADASVDVVISNCVVNLSTEKPRVFAEIARVLRPGGRVGISDVVADDTLSAADRAARGDHAGCIAGALSFGEYAAGLAEAGLAAIELVPTHAVGDGMYGAIVRAVRPAGGDDAGRADAGATAPAMRTAAAERAAAAGLAAARALPAEGVVPLGGGVAVGAAGSCSPGGSCCG